MNKPVLVVMAAGMGSRYGGMKQIDPVGRNGQVIVDYSLYDARRAGSWTSCQRASPSRRAVSSPGAPATRFWPQSRSSTAPLPSSMRTITTARRHSK